MRFTLNRNKSLAIAIVFTHFLAQSSKELDGDEKLAVSMTAAAAAAALQVLAHKRNPDGSDAHDPWTSNDKKENE